MEPCPFCGSKSIRVKANAGEFWGHCRKCFADGPMMVTEAEAAASWNARAIMSSTTERYALGMLEDAGVEIERLRALQGELVAALRGAWNALAMLDAAETKVAKQAKAVLAKVEQAS